MISENVVQFKNACGKPIEVLAIETQTQLHITIREVGKSAKPSTAREINHRHNDLSESSNSYPQSPSVDRYSRATRSNSTCSSRNKSQCHDANISPMDTTDNGCQFLDSATSVSISKTLFFVALATIFVISSSLSYSLNEEPQPSSLLPFSILLTAIPLMYTYYKFYHQVTDESLLILKRPQSITLSSKRKKESQLIWPSSATSDDDHTDYQTSPRIRDNHLLHLKKTYFGREERKLLPLNNLKIYEKLRKGWLSLDDRIVYSLVIESTSKGSIPSGKGDGEEYALGSLSCMAEPFNSPTSSDNKPLSSELEQREPTQFDEVVIFDHLSPKLDCIEYILSKIKAIS